MKPDTSIAATVEPSPNHGERLGRKPDSIILHYTGITTGEAALRRLCDVEAQVSAHYLVYEDGSVFQLVPEARRAWHAGIGYWAGDRDMNTVSIGIEIANAGHLGGAPPYPESQIAVVIALCQDIIARHKIKPQRVLGHSDLAPDRKIDPGEYFPWERLAKAGVGHYVAPCPIEDGPKLERGAHGLEVERLQSLLAIYGYGLNITGLYGSKTHAVVSAFQRHFRPELVDGIADVSTIATLRKVIAAQPK
ncbi:peptidoglycan recognition protein family protein [Methylocapsa acidiphila]|uniref:peptidoglycan recognition protein family protein n=1 Tax=Methylocapsa acidiphila TaxID=133552 RepID=UPI000423ED8B|nr:N-acetylmuramoyl-L-alanine amidase [Methylocapsa acidiphila]